MRFLLISALFLFGLSAMPVLPGAIGQQLPVDKEVARLVDDYVDLRFDATADSTAELLKALAERGIEQLPDLERLLRQPRAAYPDTSDWVGKITVHDVTCLHVDYHSRYLLYVPKKRDPDKPLSLVVVGHGGNSSMSPRRAEAVALAYLKAYQPLADNMNTLLVAPASSRGWGHIGNSLVLSTISDVQRAFPVDPDRIYITGQSMGGHLSYRAALTLSDRFGAVSPHSGGYDFVEKGSIGNLLSVPGYAVWGSREPYGIRDDNQVNARWGKSHQLDWVFVEKQGGHEIYADELPKIARFFSAHPRNLYRTPVYLRSSGTMKFTRTWQIKGWPEHLVYSDTKPLRWNMRHWIQVTPRPDLGQPLTVLAVNEGNNRFEIVSENVRQLTVFLHPKMADPDKPVVIRVNGKEVFHATVQQDPALMFDLAREFDDRGRVFHAKVDLEIDTDKEANPDRFLKQD